MRSKLLVSCGALALLVAACSDMGPEPATGPAAPGLQVVRAPAGRAIPGRYVVLFKPVVRDARGVADRIVRAERGQLHFAYEHAVHGFAADLSDQAIERLRNDPNVLMIVEDGLVFHDATQSPTPSWGLDRIDQVNRPGNGSYTYNRTGAGVHFYGIDTGILGGINGTATTPHNEFVGRLSTGFDAITAGGLANDCDGHGTHTAATAAGTVYGVAKQMTIHPVRVLNCAGSGTYSQVIAGVNWVTGDHQAHPGQRSVANMSLGGGLDPATNTAVRNSILAGVVYTVSAGNNYPTDACTQTPAAVAEALTVASSDSTDVRSSFSNIGSCVDLFAPGGIIRSAYIGGPNASAVLSGTSMSAPHVAGVAGLYLEANPGATPAQVHAAIVSNATTGKITGPGTGTPNRLLYMGFIGGGGGGPNQPPVANFTASCNTGKARQCQFNASSSSDDVGIVSYHWTFGDGAIGLMGVMKHTFPSNGTYQVTLTVTDGGGLTNAITKSVVVGGGGGGNQPPVAAFTSSCTNLSCSFNGTGSTDDVGITSYAWTFGDGGTGTGATPQHSYAAAGTYTVTLTVTDGGGLTNSVSHSVTVSAGGNQAPVANFTVNCNTGKAHQCAFDASSSSDDVGIVSYRWDFGDGIIGGVPVTKHTYQGAPRTVTVTLTVTDGGGLTGSKSVTVNVP
jgi:PKD repeat protein